MHRNFDSHGTIPRKMRWSSSSRTGVLHKFWSKHLLSILVIDEPIMRTLPQTRPLGFIEHVPKQSALPVPLSFAKKPKTRIWIVARRKVLGKPSSRLITIAQVITRRDRNFNRPAWSKISQSLSTAFLPIICRPTAFLPRHHQETSFTGHKSSSEKDRENLT